VLIAEEKLEKETGKSPSLQELVASGHRSRASAMFVSVRAGVCKPQHLHCQTSGNLTVMSERWLRRSSRCTSLTTGNGYEIDSYRRGHQSVQNRAARKTLPRCGRLVFSRKERRETPDNAAGHHQQRCKRCPLQSPLHRVPRFAVPSSRLLSTQKIHETRTPNIAPASESSESATRATWSRSRK